MIKVFGLSLADIILERFKDFMRGQPEPYKFLQVFYAQEKERFLNDKMNEYIKQNKSKEKLVFYPDKALSVRLEER
ncbi:hypothetical protein ATCC49503_13310 [Helicobacter pylori]|nr:hypothetical protein ATCC49503_13310 [Helicobacter pylori]